MIKNYLFSALFFLLTLDLAFSQAQPEIIPIPASYKLLEGEFLWDYQVGLVMNDFSAQGNYLQQEALRLLDIPLSEMESPSKKISISQTNSFSQGYKIRIQSEEIVIEAANEEGAFYGVISLLQLAHAAKVNSGKITLPNWEIQDKPRYEWRGVMLDESRYFFGMEKVKQLLDHMAYYKLNTFHWHLTDAPGWRIDIKGFPKLATVGGIGNHSDPNAPATYYTQEGIKEIVRYASERMITVIPEIDMPGHATAANRAYPEYKGVEDYFFERMADTLFQMNNKVLAWDEMAGAKLPRDKTIIFWWRHDKKEQLRLSLQNGYSTVICPRIPFYFDFLQQEEHKYGRKWAGAFAPLVAVYDFEVEDFGVKPEEKPLILGIQANLWTETVHNEQRFDFLMYPRIAALAEVVWSEKAVKSYAGFKNRLSVHLEKYKAEKIYYFDPFEPDHHPEPVYEP